MASPGGRGAFVRSRPDVLREADGDSMQHGGSFRTYMHHKMLKLDEQFEAKAHESRSSIFKGVAVHVNGYTVPSHQDIKALMAEHGGVFVTYPTPTNHTHIICNHLTDAKIKQFEKARLAKPVVRSEWITDSIKAGKLLPLPSYLLSTLRDAQGQKKLFSFDLAGPSTARGMLMLEQGVDPKDGLDSKHEHHDVDNADSFAKAEADEVKQQYTAKEMAEAQAEAAELRAACDLLKGAPKSSKDDPNFVSSFFSASRLHFIGMWKMRLENLILSKKWPKGPSPGAHVRDRTIFHVDLDCFFASAIEADHPIFRGKPLAVSHSNGKGTAEVSSANYEARKYGVHAGMLMASAKERCPELIVVPYDFDRYQQVSEQAYKEMMRCSSCVQPLSCDEAFIDVTALGDPASLAEKLRASIFEVTSCTASVGIGPNLLLARLATKKAKPNGQYRIAAADVGTILAGLELRDLPGVGWATAQRLEEMGITTVPELQDWSKERLQSALGERTAVSLWEAARGIDHRKVVTPAPRKSLGAEVNWGVRFETQEDADAFLKQLAEEVWSRLQMAGLRGRCLTLKLKKRKEGETNPVKFLGCGICDNLSRSLTLASFPESAAAIHSTACEMLRAMRCPPSEIRGIGLNVTKLETSGPLGEKRPRDSLPQVLELMNKRIPKVAAVETDNDDAQTPHKAVAEHTTVSNNLGGTTRSSADDPFSEEELSSVSASWSSETASPPPNQDAKDEEGSDKVEEGRIMEGDNVHLSGRAQTTLLSSNKESRVPINEEKGSKNIEARQKVKRLSGFQGRSLTQIDAAELAALPWEVQQEIVLGLPRTGLGESLAKGPIDLGGTPVMPGDGAPAGTAQARDSTGNRCLEGPTLTPSPSTQSPLVALPSISKIDAQVLNELPWEVRRELEEAYRGRSRGAGNIPLSKAVAAKGTDQMTTSEGGTRKGIDSFVRRNNGVPEAAAQRRRGTSGSSLLLAASDVDPAVLAELPQEMVDEVLSRFSAAQRARLTSSIQSLRRSKAAETARRDATLGDASHDEIAVAQQQRLMDLPPHLRQLLERKDVTLAGIAEEVLDYLQGNEISRDSASSIADVLAWRLVSAMNHDLESVASALRIVLKRASSRSELLKPLVVDKVQQAVQARYGAPLILKSILE